MVSIFEVILFLLAMWFIACLAIASPMIDVSEWIKGREWSFQGTVRDGVFMGKIAQGHSFRSGEFRLEHFKNHATTGLKIQRDGEKGEVNITLKDNQFVTMHTNTQRFYPSPAQHGLVMTMYWEIQTLLKKELAPIRPMVQINRW